MQNGATTNIYALQVKTKGEEKFIRHARAVHPEFARGLSFPQRCLDIRKGGKVKPSKLAVFPGYVFLELGTEKKIQRRKWYGYKGAPEIRDIEMGEDEILNMYDKLGYLLEEGDDKGTGMQEAPAASGTGENFL
jgi:transcription antitermination factor NusG